MFTSFRHLNLSTGRSVESPLAEIDANALGRLIPSIKTGGARLSPELWFSTPTRPIMGGAFFAIGMTAPEGIPTPPSMPGVPLVLGYACWDKRNDNALWNCAQLALADAIKEGGRSEEGGVPFVHAPGRVPWLATIELRTCAAAPKGFLAKSGGLGRLVAWAIIRSKGIV